MVIYILVLVFVLGLVIGSFTNCFIWRLYKKESLWNRSYCPKCRGKISWYDNIPLLSYLILKGKCRKCKKAISLRYPIVEFVVAFLFTISFYLNYQDFFKESLSIYNFFLILDSRFLLLFLRDFFVIFVMTVIFIYDLKWMIIPDKVILPACIIVFIINLFLNFSFLSLFFMGIIGASFFLFQFVVSRGRWIGGGDIRLGLFMGLLFGRLDYLITALCLTYFIGSIISIWLLLVKKSQWSSKIPLGIFLSFATIITLFFGREIVSWYLNLF